MAYAYRNQDPEWRMAHPNHPETRLYEHVSGAIERGEGEAIVEKRTADNVIKFGEILFSWNDPKPNEYDVSVNAVCGDCDQAETFDAYFDEVEDVCANVSTTHDQVCLSLD